MSDAIAMSRQNARATLQSAARAKLLQATATEFAARQQADIASLEMVVAFLRASGSASAAELEPFALRIQYGNRCHDAFFADLERIVGIDVLTKAVEMVDKLKNIWWEGAEQQWKRQHESQEMDSSPAPTVRRAAPTPAAAAPTPAAAAAAAPADAPGAAKRARPEEAPAFVDPWAPTRHVPEPETRDMTLKLRETVQVRVDWNGKYELIDALALVDTGNLAKTLIDKRFAVQHKIYDPASGLGREFMTMRGVTGEPVSIPVVMLFLRIRGEELTVKAGVHDLENKPPFLLGMDVLNPLFQRGFSMGAASV